MRHFAALMLALFALASPAWAMSVSDVLDLLRAGVSESVILDQVDAEDARFQLDTEDILALKNMGASDDLVRALIATGDDGDERDDADWTDDYYANDYYRSQPSSVTLSFAYDPFGYYWYCSPYYYGYYYPFRTVDFGWYYGGCLSRSWWSWYGYWPAYYRSYCFAHYPRVYHHYDSHVRYHGYDSGTRHSYADRSNDRTRSERRYSRDTTRRSSDPARRSIDRSRTPRTDRYRDPAVTRTPDRRQSWSDRDRSRVQTPRTDRSHSSPRVQAPSRSTGRSSGTTRSSSGSRDRSSGSRDADSGRRWGR
ncbi:MAG: hypothetical protein KC729_12505 [Candidatus Eisenbacteria bacterium]|uniref:DUF3300 domain-containing protein n=1 Tax=Eiseniibacteriota bacterium TaxID=2212470 RepID=A0A956RPC2_UNCEI|nr:hypothetical protein [Candidatus Eisenbacteria bacterium]